MARPAPVHALAPLGVVLDTVPHALRLEPFLDPEPGDVGEPGLARGLVHGHEVLIEEPDEVDAEALARVLHEVDDVARAVVPDEALVRERDVALAVLLGLLQIAGDPQVEAEAADQRAAVARVDVEPPSGQHPLFGVEGHAVLEVDLEGKQLPFRVRQRVDVVEQWLLLVEARSALGVAPDEPGHRGPVAVRRVQPAEQLRERHERLAHDADVHLGQEAHDVVRHAREEPAAGHHEGLGHELLRQADDVLDRAVRRGDPAEGDHIPAVRLEHLGEDRVRGAPGVGVEDLHEVAFPDCDRGEQRHPVRDVAGVVLLADHRVDEEHLSH